MKVEYSFLFIRFVTKKIELDIESFFSILQRPLLFRGRQFMEGLLAAKIREKND